MNKTRQSVRKYAMYGFGKASRSLCRTFSHFFDPIELIVYSRTLDEEKKNLAQSLNIYLLDDEEIFFSKVADLGPSVLFIATPDDSLESVGISITRFKCLPSIVAHLSGNRWHDVLGNLPVGVHTAQFHPLASLSGRALIPQGSTIGIGCADARAKEILSSLATDIECLPINTKKETLNLYHSAAVLAGNLPLALLSMSLKLFERCGIDRKLARKSLASLMKSAADGAQKADLGAALTGPLARGDVQTIKMHLNALEEGEVPEVIVDTYKQLTKELFHEKKMDCDNKRELAALLEEDLCQ